MSRSLPLLTVVTILVATRQTTAFAPSTALFLSPPPSSQLLAVHPPTRHLRYNGSNNAADPLVVQYAKKKWDKNDAEESDDEEEDELPMGMEEAFQKLDSLDSLEDAPSSGRPTDKSSSSVSSSVPLEKEIEVYKNLVDESESKEDVYSNVLADMTTTVGTTSKSSSSSSPLDDPAMQQALADALQEASTKNPTASNALNDKEIMKEIEAIMERGNAELLASLEEIRQEQVGFVV
eukprot:scaffold923_cov171-Amphora_coffeaeformis.AAC.16